jgi:AcrR family transcriptional regulator
MQIQRARMLDAMVRVACAQGAARVSVADVVGHSGVSRRTFYEVFDSSEDCLHRAIEEALARTSERVLAAYEQARGGWRTRIRAGLVSLLGFFEEQPETARLLVVEWLAAGPRELEHRGQVLERIAAAIDEGRTAPPSRDSWLPVLAGEAVVGGVLSVLHERLAQGEPGGRLLELTNPLMGMIVLPYLGVSAARGELERAIPDPGPRAAGPAAAEDSGQDLLKGLNMRLTYRTMRVLAAIAAHPGGSNRVVARGAGVDDQGQISKLLMRLRKLGLVENRGAPVKGEANAWFLSATGEQVERLLRH